MSDTGVQKGAILMLALGEDEAAEVMKYLGPREVQKLGAAMSAMKAVQNDDLEKVLSSFIAKTEENTSIGLDSDEYIRTVLTKALGDDKASSLLNRILGQRDASGIESLKWMDSESVADLIRFEHPQIIATILVHLDRDHASGVLTSFDERTRNDVMHRIATLDGIQPNALKELNDVLSKVLAGGDRVRKAPLGGAKTAAEILNFLGSGVDANVLGAIRDEDPDLAGRIEEQMFTFADLLKLDNKSMQRLLREVNNEQLVVALKGAEPEMRDHVFTNMSSRAADTLREDLESKGPVRMSDVDAEQKGILKIARRLADEGEIMLGGGGDESFV